jgi:hypothetical protein
MLVPSFVVRCCGRLPNVAEGVYLRLLDAVGANAGDIGRGIIAAHWPFVGSDSAQPLNRRNTAARFSQ